MTRALIGGGGGGGGYPASIGLDLKEIRLVPREHMNKHTTLVFFLLGCGIG